MANRRFYQFRLARVPDVAEIFAKVTIGGTGAPTLVVAQSVGIKSVTRVSAGKYTFVFGDANTLDTYVKLLNIKCLNDTSGASDAIPAAPIMYMTDDSSAVVGTSSIELTFANAAGGAATDPASGEALYLQFVFKNSSAY